MKRHNGPVYGDAALLDIAIFIGDFITSRGYCPSIREIGDHASIQSTSVIRYLVDKIASPSYGWVDYEPRISRSIHLTKAGKEIYAKELVHRAKKRATVSGGPLKVHVVAPGD